MTVAAGGSASAFQRPARCRVPRKRSPRHRTRRARRRAASAPLGVAFRALGSMLYDARAAQCASSPAADASAGETMPDIPTPCRYVFGARGVHWSMHSIFTTKRLLRMPQEQIQLCTRPVPLGCQYEETAQVRGAAHC